MLFKLAVIELKVISTWWQSITLNFAQESGEIRRADAVEGVDTVDAFGSIEARIGIAVVWYQSQ